jgi:acyl-CoA synthetase (AMP-forming)/AMP-acid ligase II
VINHTTKPDKLVFMLNDCSATAFIVHSKFAHAIESVDSHVDSVKLIVTTGKDAPPERKSLPLLDFARDLESFPSSLPDRSAIDIDLAALIYTSGSTGLPKGAAVSHLNVVSASTSICQYLENERDDVIINVLPLSFDYGLYQPLMSAKVGATLVLEKSFAYPFRIIEKIQEERVTGFPGVPTIFAILLQMSDVEPERFDGVRYVTNTAAALPPAHILGIRSLFRKAKIYSMYGLTECKRVSYLPPDEIDKRPTSVGKAMPNVRVSVVDEGGNPVPTGTVGELVVRGSNVMMGYWNRPDDTAEVVRPGHLPSERVLYTGDLFTMDEDGYLYFVSRKDDIIKSRGEKVSPREVETVIYELPEVRETVVVGVPDPILGQAVNAFVVAVEGAEITEKEIIFHCASRLENLMVPSGIEFRDSLPKTTSGKIDRGALQREIDQSSKGNS